MNPLRVSALLLAILLTAASAPPPLPPIPPNTWVQVHPTYSGAPNGGQIWIQGWNNMGVYDPGSRCTISMDRWLDPVRGSSIYANGLLAYDPAANNVSVLKLTNWFVNGSRTDPLPANATDPTPVDRHPLGGVAFIPSTRSLYLVNGLNQTAPNGHPNDTWKFDLASATWSKVADAATGAHPPNNGGSPAVMAYDSAADRIVMLVPSGCGCAGTDVWLLDPSTKHWSAVTQDPSGASVYVAASGAAYDPRRNRILTLGGGNYYNVASRHLWAYSVSQNKWTALADAPIAANAPGFAYDSTHDVFLALVGTSTLIYDPVADRWTTVATPFVRASVPNWQSVTYNVAQDLFVYQGGDWSAPIWNVFRYNGTPVADTLPPTVPSGVAAAAVSSSAIDLSWGASTDNVGVTGYRVYRNGTLAATIASGTTYHDTGLSASTTYSYTVVAFDAAGNASSASAPVTATTSAAAGGGAAGGGAAGTGGSHSSHGCGLLGIEALLLGLLRRLRR